MFEAFIQFAIRGSQAVLIAVVALSALSCSDSSGRSQKPNDVDAGFFCACHAVWRVYSAPIDGTNPYLMKLIADLQLTDEQLDGVIAPMAVMKTATDMAKARGGDLELTETIYKETRKLLESVTTDSQMALVDTYFACDTVTRQCKS